MYTIVHAKGAITDNSTSQEAAICILIGLHPNQQGWVGLYHNPMALQYAAIATLMKYFQMS
jgi:hypothetical protein